MGIIDKTATERGYILQTHPTLEEVNSCYNIGVEGLSIDTTTEKGRVRSRAKLSWQPAVRLQRKAAAV